MGVSDTYRDTVQHLVDALCQRGLTIVYGGGYVGLMGVVADQTLKNHGNIIGVIPRAMVDIELAHPGLTALHIVDSMNERKVLMAELSDAFILLPGGVGSLDEFFEMVTLRQLRYQNKPCAILNSHHYYDHLIKFLDHANQEGFLTDPHHHMFITTDSIEELLMELVVSNAI